MGFNPILETNIQPTQQVQKPSTANAVVGLLDSLGVFKAPPAPPSATDMKAQDRINYFNTLSAATQLNGTDPTRANQMVTDAFRTWAGKYGLDDTEVANSYQAFSGIDPTRTAYGHDTQLATVKSQPDYPLQYEYARHTLGPNATEEQLEAYAVNRTQTLMFNKAKLDEFKQNADVAWVDIEPVYAERSRLFAEQAMAMAKEYNADNIITIEESQMAQKYFNDYVAGLVKPAGVSDEKWDAWKESNIDGVKLSIDAMLQNALSEGPATNVDRALSGIFQAAIKQDKIPPQYLVTLANPKVGAPDKMALLLELAKVGDSENNYIAATKSAIDMNMSQLLHWVQEFPNMSPDDIVERLDASEFAKNPDKEAALTVSIVQMSSKDDGEAAVAMYGMTEQLQSIPETTVAVDLAKRIYTPAFFKRLETIEKVNPAVGADLRARATEALAIHMANSEAMVASIARQNGFEIARNAAGNYDFMLSRDMMTPAMQRELDTYFGGNIKAAEKARGKAGRGGLETPNLSTAFKQIDVAKAELTGYSNLKASMDALNGKMTPEPKPTEGATTKTGENVDSSTPEWQRENLTTIRSSNGEKWQVNKQAAAAFQGFLDELESMGYSPVSSGGYNYRNIRGSNKLSEHATGNAIDINATANALGSRTNDFPPNVSAIAAKYGLAWGGDWKSRPDPMHFEYIAGRSNGGQEPFSGDVANAAPAPATSTFTDMAAAGEANPLAMARGNQMGSMQSSASAPSVSSATPTQPTAPESPDLKVTQAQPQAIPQNLDPEVQNFINGLTQKYQASKNDASKKFATIEEMLKAKADGKISSGDVVWIGNSVTMVP